MRFQTLADWRFHEFQPIQVQVKGRSLQWDKNKDFENYTVFFSKDSNPINATLLYRSQTSNQLVAKKSGYYWVMANNKLSITSDFYGKNIPVAVKNYIQIIPITDPILVN